MNLFKLLFGLFSNSIQIVAQVSKTPKLMKNGQLSKIAIAHVVTTVLRLNWLKIHKENLLSS